MYLLLLLLLLLLLCCQRSFLICFYFLSFWVLGARYRIYGNITLFKYVNLG